MHCAAADKSKTVPQVRSSKKQKRTVFGYFLCPDRLAQGLPNSSGESASVIQSEATAIRTKNVWFTLGENPRGKQKDASRTSFLRTLGSQPFYWICYV